MLDTSRPLKKTALPAMSPPRAWIPLMAIFVMVLGISTTGFLLYEHYAQNIARTAHDGLTAIADLKVGQITLWLNEQLKDADAISRNNLLADATERWLQQGAPEGREARDIRAHLASLRQINQYQSIVLVDEQGRPRLEDGLKFDLNEIRHVLRDLHENAVVRSDIHWSAEKTPELNFVAPLVVPGTQEQESHVIGAVIFNVNLYTFFFPYIQQWPTPSTSGETLLVRRDGNEVLFLTELRHRKDTARKIRLPIDQPTLVAALALRGETEVMKGVDYRGVPVIAAARKVPDTSWILVAKMDLAEVNEPIHSLAVTAGVMTTLFIIFAVTVSGLWWRKQSAQYRAALFQEQIQRQALVQHFDYAAKYARDMIMLIDETGRMVDCNDAVLTTYGYTQDELLHLNQSDLRAPRSGEQMMFANLEGTAQDLDEGITYETTHRRKDGSEFPVEVSLRRIEIEGKRYLHLVLRDIAWRKQAEEAARASELQYRRLFESARDGILILERDSGRIIDVNPYLCELLGYTRDTFIGQQLWEIGLFKDIADSQDSFLELQETGYVRYEDLPLRKANGQSANVEFISNVYEVDGSRVIQCNIRDITQRKLAEANQRKLANVVEQTGDAVLITDHDGVIEYVNPMFERMTGYSSAEALGHKPDLIKSGMHEEAFYKRLWETILGGETYREVFINRRKNGELYYGHETITPIKDAHGRIINFVSTSRDISEQKTQENRIARLTRIHTVLSQINSTIIRVRRREDLFEESCRIAVEHGEFQMAWIGLVDKATQEIKPAACQGNMNISLDVFKLSVNPDVPEGRTVAGQAMRDKTPVICNDIENAPELIYGEIALAQGYRSMALFPLVVAEETMGLFSLFSGELNFFDKEEIDLLKELAADISFALDYLEKTERANYLAYYDAMTSLPNHGFFIEHFNRQLLQSRSEDILEAMVLVDIERFHNINDTLGRHVGDDLLKNIANRLKECIGEHGILARLEGDRFAFELSGMEKVADIVHFMERDINDCFTRTFLVEGTELRLAARFGIALYPYDGNDADTLYKNAETALNKAKQTAERLLLYEPTMNARMVEMLVLEGKLQQAIAAGQFVLHYQPQVHARTGHIIGMEALIRWNDPDTGMVPPNDFIPLLEDTRLIYEVGRWVLVQAASDYINWYKQGLHPPCISVNISTLQLRRADFISVIKATADTLPEENCLELEITESLIMEDVEQNIQKLVAVRDMGVNTVIDDFGTGYSSLRYIAKLPIHAVKIDREFIVNMTRNQDDLTIVTMILSLAHELDLQVIAEGVDTEEQLKMLRLLKCDAIQGFLFSEPLPFDEIQQLLRSGKPLLAA